MSAAEGYKATYDYVELTVEKRERRWVLTLKDHRHGDGFVHDEDFDTAAEAMDVALPLAKRHISIAHNDTLLAQPKLTWQTL